VTEGTITKWFKQVGDQVKEDEVLFESRPTRSTRRSRRRPPATSPRSSCRKVTPSTWAPSSRSSPPTRRRAAATARPRTAEPEATAAARGRAGAGAPPEAQAPAPEPAPQPEPAPKAEPAAAAAAPRLRAIRAGTPGARCCRRSCGSCWQSTPSTRPRSAGTGQGAAITRADVLAFIDKGGAGSRPQPRSSRRPRQLRRPRKRQQPGRPRQRHRPRRPRRPRPRPATTRSSRSRTSVVAPRST